MQGLGLVNSPSTARDGSPHVMGGPLPEQYVIPAWAACFDPVHMQPVSSKIRARILDQKSQSSCVGHGTSVMKSAQEGVLISPRDIFRLAKTLDGNPEGWGTSLSAAQDALVKYGAAEDYLVNRDPSVTEAKYRSQDDVNDAVKANRLKHRGQTPFSVPRTLIRETLAAHGVPVVTGCNWFEQDNRIGKDGSMKLPSGDSVGGHCFACIGWVVREEGICLIMVNSFGPEWGADGLFYVPIVDVSNRLFGGHVVLDVPEDVAEVVSRFEGKTVKVVGSPDHYQVVGGKARKYPDEICFWAHGRRFSYDVFDILPDELDVLPKGPPMDIAEAPFENRELVRQIRQFYGKA